MTTYFPPTKEILFTLKELAGLADIAALSGYEDASPDLIEVVLEEAGKLASEVLVPINSIGDQQGCQLVDRKVQMPDGFAQAYQLFIEGGWMGISQDQDYGGQGLPGLVQTAVSEMWNGANISFGLNPLLTSGAIEAVKSHADGHLKDIYLPKMISGEWSGTMNLTESSAGSDLSAVRTRAVPNRDHYLISGQKIFITWGDHELADNVVHLVLARLPDAPEGVKGISLFLVPKFLVNADGSLGRAHRSEDPEQAKLHSARVDLLVPVAKGWCTEVAQEVATLGVQIHGGMGFIEETGAAQHFRDARIITIYEGTTGIQAIDLVGRKILRDQGAALQSLIEEMDSFLTEKMATGDVGLNLVQERVLEAVKRLRLAKEWVLEHEKTGPCAAGAVSCNLLMLLGTVLGGYQLARAADIAQQKLAAAEDVTDFYRAKIMSAVFYAEHVLPRSRAYLDTVLAGASSTMALAVDRY